MFNFILSLRERERERDLLIKEDVKKLKSCNYENDEEISSTRQEGKDMSTHRTCSLCINQYKRVGWPWHPCTVWIFKTEQNKKRKDQASNQVGTSKELLL